MIGQTHGGYCERVGGIFTDIVDWFGHVGREFTRVSVPLLLLALVLQGAQTTLNALAWRNILRAAYPDGDVRFGPVFGAYAGGIGINHVLPAQAGTVAMVGLFRVTIAGATVPGLVGAGLVQTTFFAGVGVAVYAILLVTQPGAEAVHFGALMAHPWITLLVAVAVVVAVALLARLVWRRFRRAVDEAREGAAILRTPTRFVVQVLLPQAGSYVLRMIALAVLMSAYGLSVSPRGVLLVIAAVSLSTLVALTPGGIGTQQALIAVALRDAAPAATVAAYSIGQQIILTAWDLAFGLVALILTFGWASTRALLSEQRAEGRRAKARAKQGGDPGGRPD